jgi:molecular chaperone IbpA
VRVEAARLEKGMLFVDLVREVPEAMKPRRIAIGTGTAKAVETARIEARKAA